MKIIRLLILILVMLFINGCGSDNPVQGLDLTDLTERGKIRSTVLDSIELEVSFSKIAATGESKFLSLGSFDNIETQILLRFESIPESIRVDTAAIILFTHAIIGEKSGSFTAHVHQILTDWDELTVTDTTFANSFDQENILGSAEIFPTVGDTSANDSVRIEFDAQLVNAWIDSTVANQGILINFSNSGFIKEFFSRDNNDNRPQLELHFTKNGLESDTTLMATADAFLVRSLMDPPPGPLYVGNAILHQSVIKFNLFNIPKEATINRAVLQLNVQSANSLLKEEGIKLTLIPLAEPFDIPDSLQVNLNFANFAELKGTDTSISIPIINSRNQPSVVQAWITELIENQGLIITAQSPGLDVTRVAFFSTEIAPSLAPKIQIDFTLPPEGP